MGVTIKKKDKVVDLFPEELDGEIEKKFEALCVRYGMKLSTFHFLFEGMIKAEMECPSLVMVNEDRKWEAVSSYQKSVRRGNKEQAFRAAAALLNTEENEKINYLWRRVAVTAIEDIGLAEKELVAFVLLCNELFTPAKFKGLQRQVVLYLTDRMCYAVKDRSLCDMAIIDACYLKQGEEEQVRILKELPVGLQQVLMEVDRHWEVEPQDEVVNFISKSKWRTEDMGKFYPLALKKMTDGDVRTDSVIVKEMTPFVMLAGLPSYCYDMHTRVGKKAIIYLQGHEDLKAFFTANPVKDKTRATGWAVFYAEGGNLDKELDYLEKEALYQASVGVSLIEQGLSYKKAWQLIDLIRELIPSLDGKRDYIAGKGYR